MAAVLSSLEVGSLLLMLGKGDSRGLWGRNLGEAGLDHCSRASGDTGQGWRQN